MKILLSPAKSLDFESPLPTKKSSLPDWSGRSQELIGLLAKKSPIQIAKLMGLSDKLSQLNWDRYQDWSAHVDETNGRPAILAFTGDVYQGMDVSQFSERDFTYAQKRIRILSGLHGMLRPLDLIQPYRLEMGTKLPNSKGKDLYAFWRDAVTSRLNEELADSKPKLLVNLASNEYFGAVRVSLVAAPIVTPVFKDLKNDQYKIISFYAKKARGAMAAWLVLNRVDTFSGLEKFDGLGYEYSAALSTKQSPMFLRDPS
jgi:cytoplasmic iron level regulating protein YaaA (DUF328/UPF0246 family)